MLFDMKPMIIELFIYKQSDGILCNPDGIALMSLGHTFTLGTETFIPRSQWDTSHLVI